MRKLVFICVAMMSAAGYAETAQPLSMEGRFAYEKVIPVLLNAGAGDKDDIAKLVWIVLHKEDQQSSADLRMTQLSWPKGKWRVRLDVLARENKLLKSAESIFENGGFIISYPAISEHDIHFDLGPSKALTGARRFRVTIEPAPDDAKPNADMSQPSLHGYSNEGNRTIDVRVVGGGLEAPSVSTTLWRRIGPDYRPQPLTVFHSAEVLWEFAGALWTPCHHYAGFTKIEDLGEGQYMISALTFSRGSDDPTPCGSSGIIDLTGPNEEQTAVIAFRPCASLTVNIIDARTRKPLPKEQMLLFAPNGMPIAEGSSGFTTKADDQGTFRFRSLEPGVYRLEIGPRVWWYVLHPESVRVVPVRVNPGVENTITVPYTHPVPKRDPL